jgi:glycosyltransferase involved in cell wall biosynthesis
MKKIIYLADGAPFNSRMLAQGPMGGAETASIHFMMHLAQKGFDITAYTPATETYTEEGCCWKPLSDFKAEAADFVIAHRSPHLLSKYPIKAQRKLLYLHNPAEYLGKWKHRKYLYKHRPDVIFSGKHHASTWPIALPKTEHIIIPYAVNDEFRRAELTQCPAPKAIFTSNPLRSLDWLLDVWQHYIHPQCPNAELHLYCGPAVYRNLKPKKVAMMQAVLQHAQSLTEQGVVINQPVPKHELIQSLSNTRVMLYRGDEGESFCLALEEAQTMGIPVVTEGIAACKERVIHNKTGFIANGKASFAAHAVSLLQDDALWQQQHRAALSKAPYRWDTAANLFIAYADRTL